MNVQHRSAPRCASRPTIPARRDSPCPRARGTILVMVLVIVAFLAMVAVTATVLSQGEWAAAAAGYRQLDARMAAMSGIERAMVVLADPTGGPLEDVPEVFFAQPVDGSEGNPGEWFFTVYAPNPDDPTVPRYGLIDEGGLISLNGIDEETLVALPGMTTELAEALLDWTDTDSDARTSGAEQEHYDKLNPPYTVKNGPLATVEELLLVRGFDGAVIYGQDLNRNGLLEPNEQPVETAGDVAIEGFNRGLVSLATTATLVPDLDSEGQPRLNVNTADPQEIVTRCRELGLDTTGVFITAARAAKLVITDPSQLLDMTIEVDDPRRPGQKRTIPSGVTTANIETVMDKLSGGGKAVGGQEMLVGRVNLNSAPLGVLCALNGLGESAARAIVDRRGSGEDLGGSTAWILTQNVVSAEVFKKIAPRLTTRSCRFRVRSFGYHIRTGTFCVLEAVIDTASGTPRIVYLRDLTRLGPPLVIKAPEG